MIDHFYNIESIKSYTYIEGTGEISIPFAYFENCKIVINLVCILMPLCLCDKFEPEREKDRARWGI